MVSATKTRYLNHYKVILATEEVITATWKVISVAKKVILATNNLMLALKKWSWPLTILC